MGEHGASALGVLVVCFAPSIFLLAYSYHRVRLAPSEGKLVVTVFALGLLAGPLAMGLFSIVSLSPYYEALEIILEVSDTDKLVYAICAIGMVEEMAKFLVVWTGLRLFNKHLDPLYGGPLYAAAAALGFATVENWIYMWQIDAVIWHRALTLPLLHVLFSSFWGVGLVLKHARPHSGNYWLIATLGLSFVFHGLYDFILLSQSIDPIFVVPLVAILFAWYGLAIPRIRKGVEATTRGVVAGDFVRRADDG